MDKKEIIMTYVYKSESLYKYIKKNVDNKYIDDIKSELYISLLEMDETKLFKAYDEGYLDGLCIQIIRNQYNSSTSGFFKDIKNGGFRKSVEICEFDNKNIHTNYVNKLEIDDLLLEDIKYQETLNKIELVLNTLHWYDKILFDMNVIDGIRMSDISRMTKISQHSVLYSITKTKNKIKMSLKN